MTSYLFLGGSLDGETRYVDPELWNVRILASNSALTPSPEEVAVEEELYTRQRVAGEARTFEVFALSDWTGDMLIRHLLLRATKAQEMRGLLADLVKAVGRGDEVGLPDAYCAARAALDSTKGA